MNLKKTFLSVMAAGAILAGGFGGATAQSSTTRGAVSVTAGGTFNAYFCSGNEQAMVGDLSFDDVEVNSSSGDVKRSGSLVVCYTDTKNDRAAFTSHLSASDFWAPGSKFIDNSNLSLGDVTRVNSGQWGSEVPGVGSIAGRTSTGSATDRYGQPYGVGNNFDVTGGLLIAEGYQGMGTGSNHYQSVNDPNNPGNYAPDARSTNGSWHVLDVDLTVPQETQAGDYTNTFTINIAPANP